MSMLLDDAKLRELFSRKGRTYPAGSIIFLENEIGHEMYIIVSGQVEISKTYKEHEIFGGSTLTIGEVSELLSTLCPGDFFGEMALWNDTIRSATARAKTAVEVIVLSKGELDIMMMRSPALAMQMIKSICSRLRDVCSSPRVETILPKIQELLQHREKRPGRHHEAAEEPARHEDAPDIDKTMADAEHAAAFVASTVKDRSCAVCGYEVRPNDRYCGLCGRAIK